jgi:hypothetical protein
MFLILRFAGSARPSDLLVEVLCRESKTLVSEEGKGLEVDTVTSRRFGACDRNLGTNVGRAAVE